MVYLGFTLGVVVALFLVILGVGISYLFLKQPPDAPIRIPNMGPTKRRTERKKPIWNDDRKALEKEQEP